MDFCTVGLLFSGTNILLVLSSFVSLIFTLKMPNVFIIMHSLVTFSPISRYIPSVPKVSPIHFSPL